MRIKRISNSFQLFLSAVIFCLALSSPNDVWANKTEWLDLLNVKEMNEQASMTNLYINNHRRIAFSPRSKKVLSVDSEVVWNSYRDNKNIIITTGNEGKVFIYDLKFKLKKIFQLDSSEIFSVTRDEKGNYYFGSGPDGLVYWVSADLKAEPKVLLDTGKDFIWDMLVSKGVLYLATGGSSGELLKVDLSKVKVSKNGNRGKTVEAISLFESSSPNLLKIKQKGDVLYFSSGGEGKLYKMVLKAGGENSKKNEKTGVVTVLFDGGEKDIPDFVFKGDGIYLGTSGTGVVSENNGGDKGKFQNHIIRINTAEQMEILYSFSEKNIASLSSFKNSDEGVPQILVGLVEDMELYRVVLTDFPRLELLRFNKGLQLSSMFVLENTSGNKYYLTTANRGEIYEMENDYADKAVLISKVLDFKRTLRWGRLTYHNYAPAKNGEVKIWTRIGSTAKVDVNWSKWMTEGERLALPLLSSRFMQVKVELVKGSVTKKGRKQGEEDITPKVGDLQLYFSYRNVPHRIINLKVTSGLGENGVLPPNMDAIYGMFGASEIGPGSLELAKSQQVKTGDQSSPLPFAHYQIKDIFTIHWEVINPDKDDLTYQVFYRTFNPDKISTNKNDNKGWVLLVDNYMNNMLYLNKRKFPNGRYQFKVVASDEKMNGPDGFLDEELTRVVVIDNQLPVVRVISRTKKQVVFEVEDKLSLIKSVQYSFDHKHSYQLSPRDGVLDEKKEEFVLPLTSHKMTKEKSQFKDNAILIMAEDLSGNLYYDYIR